MFCDAGCCEQYKIQKNIMAPCESCRLENVVFEVLTFNQRERVFCSQGEGSANAASAPPFIS